MFYLLIAFAIIAADQLVKYLVVANMAVYQSIPIWQFVQLTYIQNTGASFGILADGTVFLIIMTCAVLVALLAVWRRSWMTPYRLAAAILAGGALGNLIDRICRGFVVDYVHLSFSWFPWIFNLADVAITCGVILLCIQILRTPGKPKAEREEEPS